MQAKVTSPDAIPPLASDEWLAARLGNPGYMLIDLRVPADGGRAAYEVGHVPGAVFSDYAADGWRQKVGNAPGMLPSEAHLATLLGRLGILPGSHVVFIPAGTSANDLAASARAYWTLKLLGHAAVSILDGGTRGWIASGRPVETGSTPPVPAPAYPIRWQPGLRSDVEATAEAQRTGSHALIDARASSYFAGLEKASEAKRAGHIPGAVSVDYAQLFDPARGGLKPAAELARLLVPGTRSPAVCYCNTGHTAALNWFVLSEILGCSDVALYDGSMTDWTQDDSRPVATL